ncbi:MAG: hypothetical protein ACYDHX_16010 [Methanothrix sp.]
MYIFAWKKDVWILWTRVFLPKGMSLPWATLAWVEIDGKPATKTGLEAEWQAKYLRIVAIRLCILTLTPRR